MLSAARLGSLSTIRCYPGQRPATKTAMGRLRQPENERRTSFEASETQARITRVRSSYRHQLRSGGIEARGTIGGPGCRHLRRRVAKYPPRLSTRDVAGILVAVLGSTLAIVLAATSGGNEVQRDTGSGGEGSNGSAVFGYIVAGAITLINMAHIVGLMLFQAVEYRGGWARLFAGLSLIGTPIAVLLILVSR